MTKHSWITVGVGALDLAIACTLAWWAYRGIQKRELQRDVVALVQDSTARLRAAGTRSPEWIRQVLALNQRLEKSFFDPWGLHWRGL